MDTEPRYSLETAPRLSYTAYTLYCNSSTSPIGTWYLKPDTNKDIIDSLHGYITRLNESYLESEAKRERIDRNVREGQRNGGMVADE